MLTVTVNARTPDVIPVSMSMVWQTLSADRSVQEDAKLYADTANSPDEDPVSLCAAAYVNHFSCPSRNTLLLIMTRMNHQQERLSCDPLPCSERGLHVPVLCTHALRRYVREISTGETAKF